MTNNIYEVPIVLLYLHEHRVNDLKSWLKSLEKFAQLDVTIIASNSTINNLDMLLATKHRFSIENIEEGRSNCDEVLNQHSAKLLWIEFKRFYSRFKFLYSKSLQFLADKKDAVLVTYDDRISSLIPILKASHKKGIPVFLPAILTTRPDVTGTTSNTLKPKRKIETVIACIAKCFFPHHINHEGRLFYTPLSYLVLLMFNALPKRPWIKGTLTYTNKLGVESRLAFEKLLESGVHEDKLELTGMPVYDLMDFSREDDSVNNMLLCALPQYGEHGAMNVEEAIPIVEEILLALTEFSGKVVISLHPRMSPVTYQPIVEKYGFECVVGNIDSLLKKTSLFVAASSSTTIYSSLIMGIPTIALNHIYPGSNVFRDLESITYIEQDASEIVVAIQEPKPDLEELLKKDQQLLSSSLVTDGKCGERNLNVIQSLL